MALLVISIWPVAIAWKAWIWISLCRATRAKQREVRDSAVKLGVPFLGSDEITTEEKIYVLYYGSRNLCLWKMPEFSALAVPAMDLVLMLTLVAEQGLVVNDPSELLAFNEYELAKFCEENKLSQLGRARLARWRRWHASSEAKTAEEFLRRRWNEQNNAGEQI